MPNFSDKFAEKIKTRILCSVTCPSPQTLSLYEVMWKNVNSQTGHGMQYGAAQERRNFPAG